MEKRLRNKRALVTGGSRGIGAAIVGRLAGEGAQVAFTYVGRREQAEATLRAARARDVKALAIQADSADPAAVVGAVEQAALKLGGIDILVNNAGIAVVAPIADFRLEDFDRLFAVNVRAVFVAIQAALRHMGEGGRIINLGSCNIDRVPYLGGAAYAMSKSALVGLVKGLAHELGPRGITINNIHPGPVDTDMNPATSDFAKVTVERYLAIPRYGTPAEIAALVAWLAGPESSYLTGGNIPIDGGYTA